MKRKRWSVTEHKPASATWRNPPPCGYCRKRTYPRRRDARRALRHLYPGDAGRGMDIYRCPHGGRGWHLGNHNIWPTWSEQTGAPIDCDGCPAVIHIGRPVAHLHGRQLCADRGDQAEHAAITADRNRTQPGEEESA